MELSFSLDHDLCTTMISWRTKESSHDTKCSTSLRTSSISLSRSRSNSRAPAVGSFWVHVGWVSAGFWMGKSGKICWNHGKTWKKWLIWLCISAGFMEDEHIRTCCRYAVDVEYVDHWVIWAPNTIKWVFSLPRHRRQRRSKEFSIAWKPTQQTKQT